MNEYGAFYKKHKDKLFAYLMRMTGDYHLSSDIMQESFTRYLERYVQKPQNVPLLYAIVRNALFDHARTQKRNTQLEADQEAEIGNPEHTLIVREEYRRVLFALQRLEKDERDILALVASSDLSYRDIASVIGISEANVKVRVHRARLKLKGILQRGGA
jgi:RNA polymerase sigma-70 factor (ECF subfamily)